MLIVCPHCATSYDINTSALGDEGRPVRCMRCQTVWFASTQEPVLEMAGVPGLMTERSAEPEPEAATADEAAFPADVAEPADAPEAAGLADAPAEPDPTAAESEAAPDEPAADIDAAPPLVPAQESEPQHKPGEGPFPLTGGDIEAFRRRMASKRAQQSRPFFALSSFTWPIAPLPTLVLALGAVVTILIGWRTDAVRLWPQTASLYSAIGLGVNLRGLVFENIKTSREIHEGMPVMVVEGEIVSVSRQVVDVPRLRFGVRNGLGAEIYNWTAMPSRNVAQAGERLPFRSRLASPPPEMHDISVRFYNRRDSMAGLR